MGMQRYMKGMSAGGVISAANGEALDSHQLQAVVPSLFAREAHESRSARFAPIPTIDVIDGLRREGFDPFFAQQARTRIAGKGDYTKHMVRLRHRSLARADGEAFEIILVNSNDGTSAYSLLPGFFRFVCANGLFVGETLEEVKVRHSGNAMDKVIEGSYEVLSRAPELTSIIDETKGTALSPAERKIFADAAHQLRFPAAYAEDEAERKAAPVSAEALLQPRRYADSDNTSLWLTMNTVQENIIRGGQRGRITGSNGRRRNASTRPVAGIDQNKALNRALWTMMERMAELKAAA